MQSHTCTLVDQYYLCTLWFILIAHSIWISSCAACQWWWKACLGASWAQGGREWDCYYAGGALWLLSSDREASLARQRGTTIRFVDCSASWHVEIIEGNTFTSAARQLMWSYIFWRIPSMTSLRTRQSIWSLLALYSSQLRDTFRRYFIFKRISS